VEDGEPIGGQGKNVHGRAGCRTTCWRSTTRESNAPTSRPGTCFARMRSTSSRPRGGRSIVVTVATLQFVQQEPNLVAEVRQNGLDSLGFGLVVGMAGNVAILAVRSEASDVGDQTGLGARPNDIPVGHPVEGDGGGDDLLELPLKHFVRHFMREHERLERGGAERFARVGIFGQIRT